MKVVDRFKRRILDLAIRGKLVPQDPNDEPASELLARIRAEKAKDEWGGKGRKGKRSAVGSDGAAYEKSGEDAPFELPNGWAWCRLGEVATYKKGPFGSALTKRIFVPRSKSTVKVYEQKNAIRKDSSLGSYYISEEYFLTAMTGFEVVAGDIIVSCAGTIGESYVIPPTAERGIINQALMRIRVSRLIDIDYYLVCFDHIIKGEANVASNGSAMKNIPPFDVLKQMMIPLPPLTEQRRIVARIEELFKVADSLGEAADGLAETSKRLDRKILDLAIRGKLVPQDPNDEPASELLKRIAAASHKSPCQNHEAPIDPPFEIPKSWEWCRLGEISDYGRCRSIDVQSVPMNTWSLDLEEIEKETGRLLVRTTVADKKSSSSKHLFCKGMVLYSKLRTYLNSRLCKMPVCRERRAA